MRNPELISEIVRSIANHGESGISYLKKILSIAVQELKNSRLIGKKESGYQSCG